jgi:hypothetical protein
MNNKSLFLTLCALFLSSSVLGNMPSPQERYKKMYEDTREEANAQAAEIVAAYEQESHSASDLVDEKVIFYASRNMLQRRIEQCIDGTVTSQKADCAQAFIYINYHYLNIILKHLEEKSNNAQ